MAFGGYSIAFFILATSLQPFIVYHEAQYRQKDMTRAFKEMPTIPSKETFDFVIVGGGTAGCILARRLSEKFRVLVLEAGGEPPLEEEALPQLAQLMKYLPQINWIYNSTVQNTSALETGGIIIATAGRLMGGSGSHNGAHYERGNPLDFDHWANMTKDESWKFDNVLKYFLRTENYHGRYTLLSGQHRRGGLLDVAKTEVTFRPDLYYSAGRELGYDTGLDPNGPQRIGFAGAEFNTKKGRRVSTYTAFVLPIEKYRKNLVIRRYSLVTEILIENSRAVGVLYTRHGVPRVVYASKEVIVSGGSYHSPVLLMKSGIGRPQNLRVKNTAEVIKTPVADLPVGLNLQDHVVVPNILISVEDKSVFTASPKTVTFAEFDQFKLRGTGLLAAYDSMHEGFFASSRAVAEGYPNWPDIQLYLQHAFVNGTDYLSCSANVNRERSRGQIYLNNVAQTLEDSMKPIVDYNFFSDETDLEVMLEAVGMCRKIVDTETFKKIGAKFAPHPLPDCDRLEPDSRDYWVCYIHQRASSNYHLTSTVTMGARDDPKAVVDSKLRVLGVKSLRVVDASIMPYITNANIAAAVMMIAEKASDDILHAWSQ